MTSAAFLRLEADDATAPVLRLSGAWTLEHLTQLDAELANLRLPAASRLTLDAADLERMDSAAADLLLGHLQELGFAYADLEPRGFDHRQTSLLNLLAARRPPSKASRRRRRRQRGLRHVVGWHALETLRGLGGALDFFGRTGEALLQTLRHPGALRWRELVVQLEMVGLRAIPIVMLMSYLIGVVFAYLLGIQMQKFSANHLVVDGVALGIAREMGPLITAVLVAGRSGAAFTAHLGAMKVNQEIDAIVILGLSPFQVLVLPRLIALTLMLPLLTFLADVAGIFGAAHVAALHLDIPAHSFYDRLRDVLPMNTVLFGLEKAPVFAAAIALIACHGGFTVRRDARSVGLHTTATVVRSIVAVILINAAFAVAFPEIE